MHSGQAECSLGTKRKPKLLLRSGGEQAHTSYTALFPGTIVSLLGARQPALPNMAKLDPVGSQPLPLQWSMGTTTADTLPAAGNGGLVFNKALGASQLHSRSRKPLYSILPASMGKSGCRQSPDNREFTATHGRRAPWPSGVPLLPITSTVRLWLFPESKQNSHHHEEECSQSSACQLCPL